MVSNVSGQLGATWNTDTNLVACAAPRDDATVIRNIARFGFLVPRPVSSTSSSYDFFHLFVMSCPEFGLLDGSRDRTRDALLLLDAFNRAMEGEDKLSRVNSLIQASRQN